MDTDELGKRLDELEKKLKELQTRRIYQVDIVPSAVKTRHMGEGNRYLLAGLEANRPSGVAVTGSVTAYFATDTGKLWVWKGASWVSVLLT